MNAVQGLRSIVGHAGLCGLFQNLKINKMGKHSYFPPIKNERQKKALEKARKRGEAAEEWMKSNTLTRETQAEFNALMKAIDQESS